MMAPGAVEPGALASDLPPPAVAAVRRTQERLGQLDGQPALAHIDVYDTVHSELADALAELDEV